MDMTDTTTSATALDLPTLRAGGLEVRLAPDAGGSVAAFCSRPAAGGPELHWLRPASAQALAARDPLGMASFPLVPWCNRIRDGRATAHGRSLHIPPNHPGEPEPHPLHGIGWLRPWKLLALEPARAVLALAHAADAHWPWDFEARQELLLSPGGLTLRLAATNRDRVPMPCGLGHHPYFPQPPGTWLQAGTEAMWETDAEVLPTALVAGHPVVRALRAGTPVQALHTDNNFTGWSREALLRWPADGQGPARHLRLLAQPPLDMFVLYRQPTLPFLCAEPVSQCTDWLNLQGRYPPAQLGGTELAPGATLAVACTLAPGLG
jgi:aldose 1-epimerase